MLTHSERAEAHDWSRNAVYSSATCIVIASEVSASVSTPDFNEREIQEGIIHALRAYVSGNSAERAVNRGIVHARALMEVRIRALREL